MFSEDYPKQLCLAMVQGVNPQCDQLDGFKCARAKGQPCKLEATKERACALCQPSGRCDHLMHRSLTCDHWGEWSRCKHYVPPKGASQ